jgi:hypothetical protein
LIALLLSWSLFSFSSLLLVECRWQPPMGFAAREKAQVEEDRKRRGKWSSCSEVTIPVKVGTICLSFPNDCVHSRGEAELAWLVQVCEKNGRAELSPGREGPNTS